MISATPICAEKFLDSRPGFDDNLAAKIALAGVTDAAFPAFTIPGYGVSVGFVAGNVTIPSTGSRTRKSDVYRFQTPIVDQPPSGAVDPQHIFGNSPRGGLPGAPVITTDATIEKEFHLTEQLKLDLRGEAYNLLNHAFFNVPGFTRGAGDFGVVSSARAPRTAQLSARLSF
jgi:hypothetical protein